MEHSSSNIAPSARSYKHQNTPFVDMQGSNNSKKVTETPNSSRLERQKSPNSSRRHIQNNSSGSNCSSLSPNSLALSVTPSAPSLTSGVDDRTLMSMSGSGPLDSSTASCAPGVVGSTSKATDEAHIEDDQDAGFPTGENSTNTGDDIDGTCGISSIQDSPEYQRIRMEMEHIHVKVNKTRELIRDEQTARDENVNEYLRLASQADKQQQIRLKAVFEKKNTKSAQQMQVLQRKLDSYQRRLRALEAQGIPRSQPHRAPKQVLRGVGMGIKNVITKPKEIAHLIRNKFGSADNISHIRSLEGNSSNSGAPDEFFVTSPSSSSALNAGNSSSLPGHGSQSTPLQSAVAPAVSQGSGGGKYTSEEGSECGSSVTSESMPGGLHMSPRHNVGGNNLGLSFGLESFFQELQERREEVERLREEMEQVKLHLQQEVSYVSAALQEERFRVERLEEQINDLTELHQNEVENLKQNIADMEEKVQYQSEERLRDIHDLLDSCHTRISKVEHQAQHQQHVSLEGIENSNARAVLVKLINMALTLLQLVLVVVSTAANIISPFLKTRLRVVTTCVLALVFAFILKQWSDLVDLGAHLIQHYKVVLTT